MLATGPGSSEAGLPIVVGRTLSSSTVAGVQGGELTITYTVYNEQADEVSGVLLTTTLQPGVAVKGSSVPPDRNGAELAWSLGTLGPFGRASVELVVSVASPTPLQLDAGARAFGTLNARAVSDAAPPAALRPGSVPAELLASTPDANAADPFIQEKAAALDYDPQRIVDFLRTEVGYESYTGSLRGARGTLWSAAGNALDEASLGVALFRASGIPARYVGGTLPDNLARQLIVSMFPPSFQTLGALPAGAPTADPANDPALLAETREHYWLQFDAGGGFQDADTTFAAAQVGQTFTAAQGTFAEVPDALRHKVTVRVNAEITRPGFLGSFQGTTTVLSQTFNTADLVGKTLSVGHLVSTTSIGAIFTATTNTYSPYIVVGDAAYPDLSRDERLQGQDYQDVLTNFPFASQVVTGVFVEVDVLDPGQAPKTYAYTLADRIGLSARRNGGSPPGTVGADGEPLFSPLDVTTIGVLSGQIGGTVFTTSAAQAGPLADSFAELIASQAAVSSPADPLQAVLDARAVALLRATLIATGRSRLAEFFSLSDTFTDLFAARLGVKAYLDSPRIAILRARAAAAPNNDIAISLAIDLTRDDVRAVVAPGQNAAAVIPFNLLRGTLETAAETEAGDLGAPPGGGQGNAGISAQVIVQLAQAQGVPLLVLLPGDQVLLDGLAIPADARTLIGDALSRGQFVVTPSRSIDVGGAARLGWYEVDGATGRTVGVLDDGSHGFFDSAALKAVGLILRRVAAFGSGALAAAGLGSITSIVIKLVRTISVSTLPDPLAKGFKKTAAVLTLASLAQNMLTKVPAMASSLGPGVGEFFVAGFVLTLPVALFNALKDPPFPGLLVDAEGSRLPGTNRATVQVAAAATLAAGAATATIETGGFRAAGALRATWNTTASTSSFLVGSLGSVGATVTAADGRSLGTGAVALAAPTPVTVTVAGPAAFAVSGQGSLAVYGAAADGLGVSGAWDSYSANVTGTLTLRLTTDRLTLDGVPLPAGTYTITASAATLAGAGATASPSFARSVAVTATGSTVNLEPATGSVTVGGRSFDPSLGVTLAGYTGTIDLTAGGATDVVALSGGATHVLQVSGSPATLSTDQNHPVTFAADVLTSLGDTYGLTAQAPPGWTVTLDANGNVTVTPAPAVQGGMYPIQLIARSTTNPDLVAQAVVDVTITPTQPGITLSVQPDPLFTVPLNGAEVPTGFFASIRNLGPAADAYNLTFAGVPAGFTLVASGNGVAVPAGQTGIVGLYLQPAPGQPIPAPGTQVSFTVTATGAADPSITATETMTFTVPEIHAVTVTASPAALGTTPGGPVTTVLTVTAVGNVPEVVTLTASTPGGLTVGGLGTLSLGVGQSATQTITLTPDPSTPLNSIRAATITATFGPAGSPSTRTLELPVRVAVPGADAIARASAAAAQAGDFDLAARLDHLGAALTNLVQTPASPVFQGQALANLDSIVGQLSADAILAARVPELVAARAELAGATTAAAVQAAVVRLGNALGALDRTLAELAAHRFVLSLSPSTQAALPGAPAHFLLEITNTGTEATTYDFSASGLPAGVTAAFNMPSVTLQPGERLPAGPGVTLTLTQAGASVVPLGFTVTAAARVAPEIRQSVAGALSVRDEFIRVVDVTTTPPFAEPGTQVTVSARLLNVLNGPRQVLASFVLRGPGGQVVSTSTPVAANLASGSSVLAVALGTLETAGLARGSYTVDVTVTDPAGQPIPGGNGHGTLLVGLPVDAGLTVGNQGLIAEFFDFTNNLSVLPDLSGRTPDVTRVDAQVNVPSTSGAWPGLDSRFADTFAARFSGVLHIAAPGSYTLFLSSDDGSRLWLDGQPIIDNDGLHGMVERSATLNLTAGFHDLRIELFENGGNVGLILSWSGPGIAKQVVPGTVLFASPVPLPAGSSTTLPPGAGIVTNTLSLSARATLAPPFALIGQVATTPLSTTIVIRGTVAYIAGTEGVDIVDVSNPAAPAVVDTFAETLIVQGGFTVIRELPGDRILVGSTVTLNTNGFRLLIYSVADPLNPALLSDTQITQGFLSDFVVSGSTALATTLGVFFNGSPSAGDQFDQFGDVTAINLDAQGGPAVTDRLFGTRNPPFTGDTWQTGGTIADADTAYVTSSTLTGGNFNDGVGRLLVVNFADPTNLILTREVPIPGTVRLYQVAIDGNLALVVGSTGGDQDPWNNNDADPSNDSGNTGHLTVTTLDITDRDNPSVILTVVTTATFPRGPGFPITKLAVVPVGGGKFAISLGIVDGSPVIFLVDASDPASPATSALHVPSVVNEMAAAGGRLYTTSADGLLIYNIGEVDTTRVTASVRVPKGTGVAVVAGSFSIPPTRVVAGPDFDTLVWERELAFGLSSETITWESTVGGLRAGDSRAATLGATIDFVSQGTPGTLELPATAVVGEHILSLSPASRTVRPAEGAAFTVTLRNPTSSPVTYDLSVQGVPSTWVGLPASVAVGPRGSVEVPLVLTSDPFVAPAELGFIVTATAAGGAVDSVQGSLVLAGEPATQPDPTARGVVLMLSPVTVDVGKSTPAEFVIRVTNTGSVLDTFALAVQAPPGFAAELRTQTVAVPPGASNFRDVGLRLTPPPGAAPGSYSFTVTAVSTAKASVTGTAVGSVSVLGSGVSVSLDPPSGAPGGGFQMTVTNTGEASDTFDLALSGPAALVARLGMGQVTLAPGASQVVPITTTAVGFAVPGTLALVASATSRNDPEARDAAPADIQIGADRGVAARFDPGSKVLPAPGTATFLLLVDNTGNTEDTYTAVLTGTNGPVAARLVDLDGLPAGAIPQFRLPGLATGAILLQVDLASLGQGTATVEVRSLSDGRVMSSATATVTAGATAVATSTAISAAPSPAQAGQPVTLTAIVTAQGGPPTGTVTFTIDGNAQAPVPLQVQNGQARAVLVVSAGLSAGPHTVVAAYNGGAGFLPSVSGPLTVKVVAPAVPQATVTRLLAAPNPAPVGRRVSFTAIVTATAGATPAGSVVFTIDGVPQRPVTLAVVNGQARATLSTAALGAGRHVVTASYRGGPGFRTSTSGPVVQVITRAPAVDRVAPRVTAVRRFGVHEQPTRLVLTFSEDLNPAGAANPANYGLVDPGRDGRFGTRDDRAIRLLASRYDPATRSVTLRPSRLLPLSGRFLLNVLDVGSPAVADRAGNALDGDGDGRPGGRFAVVVSRRNLVMAGPAAAFSRRPARLRPERLASLP